MAPSVLNPSDVAPGEPHIIFTPVAYARANGASFFGGGDATMTKALTGYGENRHAALHTVSA